MTSSELSQQWWSATGTWRLLRCPASAVSVRTPSKPPESAPTNAGTAAHRALQAWVESGEWAEPDAGSLLQSRFRDMVAARDEGSPLMRDAALTGARLGTRGKELAAILASVMGTVRSEVLLTDDDNHLFGILDIAAVGEKGLIIDLKTGRDAAADAAGAIEHQMTFYAHLYEASFGALPAHVIIFSLRRGAMKFQAAAADAANLLARVRAAQLQDTTAAVPHADTCKFCTKRMACEPQWDAVRTWDSPDAIEGTIARVERSSAGSVALLIDGRWLTGVPASVLPRDVAVGQTARAVRVRRRSTTPPEEWSATAWTAISTLPSRGAHSAPHADVGGSCHDSVTPRNEPGN